MEHVTRVASPEDVDEHADNTALVTAGTLYQVLQYRPEVIGVESLCCDPYDADRFMRSCDYNSGGVSDQLIRAGVLRDILTSPPPIGSSIPNTVFATSLRAQSLNGDVLATWQDVITGTRTDRVVTPYTLQALMQSPPMIGATTPNKLIVTGLCAQTISGQVVATAADVKYAMSNEKVVTPYSLRGLNLDTVPELMGVIQKLQKRVDALERELKTLTLEARLPGDLARAVISYE